MDYLEKLVNDIELLSAKGIQECFDNGVNPNDHFRNRPLIYELIGGYACGPEFRECVRIFASYGLEMHDKALLAVLMDDATALEKLLTAQPEIVASRYTLDCAFTPLYKVTLLHVCAEFNHLSCAEVLIRNGADVNAKAGYDEYGFGGQTAIFHTVNQHANKCIDLMKFLVAQSADLTLTVKGLLWGKGYEWETFIPAVNPISYAMMGLLPQFQRAEIQVFEIVSALLKAAYNINYSPPNVPNRYLRS